MAGQARTTIQSRIPTEQVFEELKSKYSVYLILKPYNNSAGDGNVENKAVRKQWLKYLDEEHIAPLGDPDRVVDVIFGILAKETGKIDYFKKEIEERQEKDKVALTYKALKTIHAFSAPSEPPKMLGSGKSKMFTKSASKTKKADDLG